MVFLTRQIYKWRRPPGHVLPPDPVMKKNFIFRMTWHFYGRRKNCYSIAVRAALKSMQKATIARKLKKKDMKKLWEVRLKAALGEYGMRPDTFLACLSEADVALNRKTLHNLAIYEPRTFQSLVVFAQKRYEEIGLFDALKPVPEGVMTRSMLERKERRSKKTLTPIKIY